MQMVSDAEGVDQNCFNQTLNKHISFILFKIYIDIFSLTLHCTQFLWGCF